MARYTKKIDKKGAAFSIRQFFFSTIILLVIIFLFQFSVAASEVEVLNNYHISNNTITINDIIDLNSKNDNDLEKELKQFKFKPFHPLEYYRDQKQGIKFRFDNFAISYYGNQKHGIRGSKQTLKFLNRINNYNKLNKINDIYLGEQKIDFKTLKISYLSDQYKLEDFKINFGLDLNYYQGEKFAYDIYKADLNFKNSVNPFYEDPIQVRGNWKEYYNMNRNNQGFGFGINSELYWKDIVFDLAVDNIGASINWDKVKYKDINIDTENANLDQDNNLEYNETVTGSWINFGYKMELPLKIRMKMARNFQDWSLGSNLKWQEWRTGDLNGTEYLVQTLFASYKHNQKTYKLEYDFKNSLASLAFKSKYLGLELLTDTINIKEAQTLALKVLFKYNF